MDLLDYLSKNDDLWKPFTYAESSPAFVSTTRHGIGSDKQPTVVHHARIEPAEFLEWINTTRDAPDEDTLLSRIVWIERNVKHKTINISKRFLEEILATFGLGYALRACYTECAGVQKMQSLGSDKTGTIQKYSFRIHPKVILIWSHNETRNLVQGVCFANSQQIDHLHKLTAIDWVNPAMMLPLMCATTLDIEIDYDQRNVKEQIRETEVRTGHHQWQSRNETAAADDLGILSARMSGAATKMAAVSRKLQVIEQLLQFVNDHDQTTQPHTLHKSPVNEDLELLKHRIEMQKIDLHLISVRVDVQLSALFNLITQKDALSNQSVAEQSRIIALASQKDSNSTRILTIAAIFYLPAQVVASIFAMPVFDWTGGQSTTSDNGNMASRRFGIYWAVTVPLTLLTFVVAWLWLCLEHRRSQQPVLPSRLDNRALVGGESEVRALVYRRQNIGAT